MKKTLLALAVVAISLASCNKKHDCKCTESSTYIDSNGKETTEIDSDDNNTVYHDQKVDCSSYNTTSENVDQDDNTKSIYKTTCVED